MDRGRLLQLLLEQGEEQALILLDANGRVVDWLMGAERIFGRSAGEMFGETVDRLFTPEDRERQEPANEARSALRTGRSEDDRWMLRGDDFRFWASGYLLALRDADGEVAGYAKILADRTDQRGQVEALRNRGAATAELEHRHSLMLGTLAHELRSPLGALTNALALIDVAQPGDQQFDYAVQILKRQTAYLSSLVDDWFDVTRVRVGKTVLSFQPVDLASVVAGAVESVAGHLAARNQRVEVLLPLTSIQLEADALRLKQVLVNLLGNASKFSAPGEPIWLRATIEGDEAVVRVEDRGRGIPADSLPHIFELLNQAGSSAPERAEGLGLGLAIVKEYVELHGGSVQVRSEGIERGSEFTVRLPLVQRVSGSDATC